MKTKKRNLFLILAACCLGVFAATFSNLNPISEICADNISYGMTFNSTKNKLHNYSGATPYSGEDTVKTNLGNNINFEYKDLMGLSNTWHVAKTGGYFTNLNPINGLEKINVSFKTNNVNYKIYWSYTTTFDDTNVYTGTSSTSSPLTFNFNSAYPSFFKFENIGGTNLNISEINFEFTCLSGTPTINVASNDKTLGTVSGGGTFVYGEKVTLTALPNDYCEFIGWYANDYLLSKDTTYVFFAEQNINIIGRFAKTLYYVNLEINDSSMGQITGEGCYTYGEQVDLIAIPNSGYSFFGWYNGDNLISQDNSLSFLMEDYDIHYEARFVKNYKITIINGFEEMGNVENASECGAGLITSVNAIPNNGYKFVCWYDSDLNVISDSSQYSFTMPNNDITLYPIFEALPFGVSIINYNDNYVSTTGAGSHLYDEEVEVFADFQKGEFLGWYLNNELVSTDNPYKFKMTPYSIQLEVIWHHFTISENILKSCPKDIKFGYIPESVTSIGGNAFSGCSSLTSIIIPDSVTSIGGNAFSGCYSLTNVYYKGTINDWCNISFYNLYSNPMLYADHFYMLNEFNEWYEVTEIVVPDTVAKIGDYQFYNFKNITTLTIGNSVTSIGDEAFYNCSSLTSITIPDSVTSIGNEAFSNCFSLTSITIGNSVTFIGKSAFNGCSSLTSITIPDSVTSIGSSAFSGCSSLTSITIPDSVTSIGDGPFNGCSSLTSITISNSVTSIGKSAFYNCSSLTSITIPDSVTSIGKNAFHNCSSLTSITIGNSVTSIGDEAFYNCSSLTSITISNSVNSIGSDAFRICSSLTNVYYKGTINDWCNISFYNLYSNPMLYADHFYMLNEFNEWYEVTEIVVPDTVAKIGDYQFYGFDNITSLTIGNSVTSIGSSAFDGCSSLTSITIPDNVTSIGSYAFSSCSSLTSINIPDAVISIGSSAFSHCSSLTSINIPDSVTSIGKRVFSYCSSLTSVTIGNSVTSIGDEAFFRCSSLTSINIPDSVTSIGDEAFYGCSSLTSINIPDDVTSIGSSAFSGCSSLTSITIPDNITSIGGSAFYGCSSLTSITIPDSVTLIGNYAFYNCSSLTSITIPNSVTSIGDSAFSRCSSLTKIDFEGTINEWKTIKLGYNWKNYTQLSTISCIDGVITV